MKAVVPRGHPRVSLSVFVWSLIALSARTSVAGYGDKTDSLPNWQERAAIVLTNACRMAPIAYRDSYMQKTGILLAANYPAVNPVYFHPDLARSAHVHTIDMAYNCGMVHNSCDGTPWSTRVKSYYKISQTIAENIARGQATPQAVVYTWLWDDGAADKSTGDGHRKNIMNADYRDIGTGFVSRGTYWTEDLGGGSTATYPRGKVPAAAHLFLTSGRTSFMLNYYDPGGQAPRSIRLILDGLGQDMALELGTQARGTYSVSVARAGQCRPYSFETVDGAGVSQRYPAEGTLMTAGEADCADYRAPGAVRPSRRGAGSELARSLTVTSCGEVLLSLASPGPIILEAWGTDGRLLSAAAPHHLPRGLTRLEMPSGIGSAGVVIVVCRTATSELRALWRRL